MLIKTTQTTAFKTAFEGINSLLNDANLEFHPDTGIIIKEVDKTGKILIFAKFEKDSFDTFDLTEKKVVGVDIASINKCLKNANNFDVLTIDDKQGCITMTMECHNKKLKKKFILNAMNLPEATDAIQPIDFTHKIIMSSSDFHNYCKNLSTYEEPITITVEPTRISFSVIADCGLIEYAMDTGRQLNIETYTQQPLVMKYDTKYLLLFSKCSNLDDKVTLYIKDGYPLVVQYRLASLGELKLVLNK
jgi:proliferating cell nuclear antigen